MKRVGLLWIWVMVIGPTWAQEELRLKHFNIEGESVGLGGYDPLTYFSGKSPQLGDKKWTFQYQGVRYQFTSENNLNQFKSNPEKYEPAYGGWCAYAMGETGEKVIVDPETFKIIDGRLYLFYNFYFTNTLKKWDKDEVRLRASADQNWSRTYR